MKQSKITFLTSIGAGLEYYDLVIYSLLADFISQQFFPSHNHVASLFATFGVLALGNIARPLGGVILGILGDRFGRKKIFASAMLWMALITFVMGVIPDFSTIGLVATVLFSLCRILQGLMFGAELPGALTLLSEHIDPKRHGLHFGFMISAVGLGVSLGSFVTWILTRLLTGAQLLAWGFRIPFLLGGGLALIAFYIRQHLPETPAFLAAQKTKVKLTPELIKKYIWQVLKVIGILLLPACFTTFFLVLPVYLHDVYQFSFSDIYLAMTCGYIWSAVLLPVFGWISDYVGRKFLLVTAACVMMVGGFSLFSLLQINSHWAVFAFILSGQTIIAAMAVSYFVLIPQAFQTAIRYTGSAFSYNIAYMIAALIPMLVNYIYGVLKQPGYIVWLFMLLAVITIVSVLILKIKHENSDAK